MGGPIDGIGTSLYLPMGLITEGLGLISPWLLPFAIFLDSVVVDMTNQCSQDPPPQPNWSPLDIGYFVGGVLNPNLQVGVQKLHDQFYRWFWGRYCRCTTGTLTTDLVTPIAPPAGIALPSPTVGQPCFAGTFQIPAGRVRGSTLADFLDATPALLPTSDPGTRLNSSGGPILGYRINGLSEIDIAWTAPGSTLCGPGGSGDIQISLTTWDANGNQIVQGSQEQFAHGVYPNFNLPIRVPSTWAYYSILLSGPGSQFCGVTVNPCNLTSQVFCGGGPNLASVACTTDPAVLALLRNIYGLEQTIYQGLPTPLRSYLRSTVHPGLSGTGFVGVQQNALAVRLDATTIPSPLGRLGGNPQLLVDMGWVTPITAEGPIQSARFQTSPQLVPLPALTTSVGYFFAPGVVATLTELLRGP